MESRSIRSYTLEELEDVVRALGQPKFRAKQLHEWIHAHNASSYDEMTNLPKALRENLAAKYPLEGVKTVGVEESADGSRKYLLQLSDGEVVECVGILSKQKPDKSQQEDGFSETEEHRRLTVCVSTQVGCAMKCAFCATGHQKLKRNLSADEIVAQVAEVGKDFGMRVGNVVVMGQGEPFQNYDATLEALRRLNSNSGMDIGARHMTVSTSGLCNEITRFAEEPEQFRLAVSLHSANQDVRNAIMPRLSGQNLKKLHSSIARYCERKGRRVTLEYMLLKDVNDTEDDLENLITFCEGLNVHVNILSYNAVEGVDFVASDADTANKWKNALEDAGIPYSFRKSKGSDVAGACGQLKSTVFTK